MSSLPPPLPIDAQERRRDVRRKSRLRIDFFRLASAEGEIDIERPRWGVAQDLSLSGVKLERAGHLSSGALLRLMMRLPDYIHEPIDCYARVVRLDVGNAPSYGLRFVGLTISAAHRLDRFCKAA